MYRFSTCMSIRPSLNSGISNLHVLQLGLALLPSICAPRISTSVYKNRSARYDGFYRHIDSAVHGDFEGLYGFPGVRGIPLDGLRWDASRVTTILFDLTLAKFQKF